MYFKRCMTHQFGFSYYKIKIDQSYTFYLNNRTLISLYCMKNTYNHCIIKVRSMTISRQHVGMDTPDVDPSENGNFRHKQDM